MKNNDQNGLREDRSSCASLTCPSSALIDVSEDRIGYVERQPADRIEKNDEKEKNIVSSLSTYFMTQSIDIVTFDQGTIAQT